MTRFLTAFTHLAAVSAATAFCPSSQSLFARNAPLNAAEIDYDAPILADPQSGTAVLDHEPIVDDECYMGKDGSATACVDFDPPFVGITKRLTRSGNAMDQPRSAPRWTYGDDFDAPVLANPQSGTTTLDFMPIVDDECYLGKDGGATDCVDFDPPVVGTAPTWTVGDDFDAPVLANPQSGTTKLDLMPIVDDECYLGKDGGATDCVDFDPPRTRSANAHDQPRSAPKWTQP